MPVFEGTAGHWVGGVEEDVWTGEAFNGAMNLRGSTVGCLVLEFLGCIRIVL